MEPWSRLDLGTVAEFVRFDWIRCSDAYGGGDASPSYQVSDLFSCWKKDAVQVLI